MQHDNLYLVEPPYDYPITIDDRALHLKTDDALPEETLSSAIASATEQLENETDLSFVPRTYKLQLESFYSCRHCGVYRCHCYDYRRATRINSVRLPRGPAQEIESITYFDHAGDLQTLDEDAYRLINPTYGVSRVESATHFPNVQRNRSDAVEITYQAGMFPVWAMAIDAIKILAGAKVLFPEAEIIGSSKATEIGLDRLIANLQRGQQVF